MFARIPTDGYDILGKQVSRPKARKHFNPTFPMPAYITQPLTVHCGSLGEIRKFLAGCCYVSDMDQFGQNDYWQPPEDFERSKRGDCDDFALWAWRQIISLGYRVRYVVGLYEGPGTCHAWVTYQDGNSWYLLEPLSALARMIISRLSVIRHQPWVSVEWSGNKMLYFEHDEKVYLPGLFTGVGLAAEAIWLSLCCVLTVMLHPGVSAAARNLEKDSISKHKAKSRGHNRARLWRF